MKIFAMKRSLNVLLPLVMLLCSCSTYHITTKSLVEQLAKTTEEDKKTLLIAFPVFIPFTVTGNSIQMITVFDKNEQKVVLPVTFKTGVRISKKNGKRKTFYLNTLLIKDSLLTGKNDHFIGVAIKPINLNDVDKIEIMP
jgi:hypothetical protein